MLQFLRTPKHDTILFGDFNNIAIKDSKKKSDNENLITADCFKRQILEPTRVTPTSSTCLDHLLTSFPIGHKTIETIFSDHYTVVNEIHKDTKNSQEKQQYLFKNRNLKNIKEDKAVNFLFPLDQKLMKLEENYFTIENISCTNHDCAHRYAPERYASYKKLTSNVRINNRIRLATTKRDIMFRECNKDPKQENREIYRR